MSVLSDSKILEGIGTGDIVITPFDKSNINPNSYDLTIAPFLKVYKENWVTNEYGEFILAPLDPKNSTEVIELTIPDKGFVLKPGELYLGYTNEVAGSKVYHSQIKGKSSLARLGIFTDCTAAWGDTGFINNWTFEISVVKPVLIYPNMKFSQIIFSTVEGKVLEPYDKKITSKYNGDNKAKESLYHLNYK